MGREPVATTMAPASMMVTPSLVFTSTRFGPTIFASPMSSLPPALLMRPATPVVCLLTISPFHACRRFTSMRAFST